MSRLNRHTPASIRNQKWGKDPPSEVTSGRTDKTDRGRRSDGRVSGRLKQRPPTTGVCEFLYLLVPPVGEARIAETVVCSRNRVIG